MLLIHNLLIPVRLIYLLKFIRTKLLAGQNLSPLTVCHPSYNLDKCKVRKVIEIARSDGNGPGRRASAAPRDAGDVEPASSLSLLTW